MQSLNKIPTIALAVLLAISVLISIMFFCGGDVDPNAEYLEPNFTGALLNWGYILIGVAAIATIIVAIVGFIIKIQADTRSAITFGRNRSRSFAAHHHLLSSRYDPIQQHI